MFVKFVGSFWQPVLFGSVPLTAQVALARVMYRWQYGNPLHGLEPDLAFFKNITPLGY